MYDGQGELEAEYSPARPIVMRVHGDKAGIGEPSNEMGVQTSGSNTRSIGVVTSKLLKRTCSTQTVDCKGPYNVSGMGKQIAPIFSVRGFVALDCDINCVSDWTLIAHICLGHKLV